MNIKKIYIEENTISFQKLYEFFLKFHICKLKSEDDTFNQYNF